MNIDWKYFFILLRRAGKFFIFCSVIFGPLIVSGQSAEISLSKDSIFQGQHSVLLVEVKSAPGQSIIAPVLNDTITNKVEIISYALPDTSFIDSDQIITKEYIVTAWEDGFHPIPPLQFYAVDQQEDTIFFESNALLLEVYPVELDMESGIRDIIPIFKVPVTFRDLAPYIIGVVLLSILGYFIFRHIKNRKKEEKPVNVFHQPDIPAHVAAVSSLEKLRNQKLWLNNKVKQHHTKLTEILRLYIGKRFNINAPEMTTAEILNIIRTKDVSKEMLMLLKDILELADLVKFARFVPYDNESEEAVNNAIVFVRENIRENVSGSEKQASEVHSE